MPGMGHALQTGNTLILSSFAPALFHQLIVIFVLVVLCAVGFNVFRTVQYRKLKAHGKASFPVRGPTPHPSRWLGGSPNRLRCTLDLRRTAADPILYASRTPDGCDPALSQPRVPRLGAAPREQRRRHLVEPSDPGGVGHRVDPGRYRTVAPGRSTRSVVAVRRLGLPGWGLVVWVSGEAFGGIFSRGRPGSSEHPVPSSSTPQQVILVYALPERAYATVSGRVVLGLSGVFLIGMAVLQAWPGRGFWQGRGGTLTGMVRTMAQTPQPGFLSSWVSSFENFVAAHGWAVNLFAVVVLATIGGLFLAGTPPTRPRRPRREF